MKGIVISSLILTCGRLTKCSLRISLSLWRRPFAHLFGMNGRHRNLVRLERANPKHPEGQGAVGQREIVAVETDLFGCRLASARKNSSSVRLLVDDQNDVRIAPQRL